MISFKNIQRFDDLPFDQYLKLPGYSQSYLKAEINGIQPEIEVTDNMRFGSMVDSILTEPEKVDFNSPFYDHGRQVAEEIVKFLGADTIQRLEKQIAFTATAESNGWTMPVRGRLDFGLKRIAVLDLKVTKDTHPNQVMNLIKFMGYDHQLYLYCNLYQVKRGYLVIHFVKYRKTMIVPVDVSGDSEFWEEKIFKFGVPIAA